MRSLITAMCSLGGGIRLAITVHASWTVARTPHPAADVIGSDSDRRLVASIPWGLPSPTGYYPKPHASSVRMAP